MHKFPRTQRHRLLFLLYAILLPRMTHISEDGAASAAKLGADILAQRPAAEAACCLLLMLDSLEAELSGLPSFETN